MVTKLSHEIRTQPKTIRKRLYKYFSPYNFLLEINSCLQGGEFDKVLQNNNIEEASTIFSDIFGSILNRHAPLKTVQVRSNYVPWISPETKQLQTIRDILKKEAIHENSNEKFDIYKKTEKLYCKKAQSRQSEQFQNKVLSGKTIHL